MIDIGETYVNQILSDSYQEFILVYKIPAELQQSKMTMVYTDQVIKGMFEDKTDDIKISINPYNLDEVKNHDIINIGNNYIIGNGLLEGHELKINNVEINESFKINYNVCVKNNECYNFYELVKPILSGVSDKAVLKLNMDLMALENLQIDVKSLIMQFGSFEYEVDGIDKSSNINKMIETIHDDGNFYFEIKKELLGSNYLNLVIKVRDCVYKIKVK